MEREIIRVHFGAIDSTNSWAKTNIHLLDTNKITIVSAEQQNEGRGRWNRKWISAPRQNLTASYCFFVPLANPPLFNFAQIMSLSASKTLEELGFCPSLKWPNDILLSGKKAGGILSETITQDDSICVIIGIGLNINMTQDLIDTIGQPATSLLAECGRPFNLDVIEKKLTANFRRDISTYLEEGFSPFYSAYSGLLIHAINQPLRFHDNDKICEGKFHSLNEDGSLNLLFPSGELGKFYSGEIH